MRCSRLGGALILAGLMAAGPALGQATAEQDPIAEAVQTLKDSANPKVGADSRFKMRLQNAQNTLANNPAKGVPAAVKLLNEENIPQIRLNAAIVLADCAVGGKSASQELLNGLQQCVADSNDAVKYYGMIGLLASNAPIEAKKAAVKTCLDPKRPRVLRMLTAEATAYQGFKEAAPLLVAYLQNILDDYEKRIDGLLTITRERKGLPGMRDRGLPGETRRPGGDIRRPPRMPRGATALPRDDLMGRMGPGAPGGVRPSIGARLPTDVRRPGDVRRLPSGARPGTTGRPGVRGTRERMPGGLPTEEETQYITEKIDPSKWTYQEVLQWVPVVQELPEYEELHLAGIYLETLVSDNPTESKFGFKNTPPWALKTCVEKAVQWLKSQGGK